MRLRTCGTVARGGLSAVLCALLALPFIFGLGGRTPLAHADGLIDLTLPGTFSRPLQINNAGQVTGVVDNSDGSEHAFFYDSASHTTVELTLGGDSFPWELNDQGQVVGEADLPDGTTHAFLYDFSTLTFTDLHPYLQTLGGAESFAYAINGVGQVVGQTDTASDGPRAFVYDITSHGVTPLGTLGGSFSSAHGINDSGQVIGESTDGDGHTHGFLYSPTGGMEPLSLGGRSSETVAINNRGQVIGNSWTAGNAHFVGFFYDASPSPTIRALTLPGGGDSGAKALSQNGHVAAEGATADGSTTHAFLYNSVSDTTEEIFLSAKSSSVIGINNLGQVVGTAFLADFTQHAYLYNPGSNSPTDLHTLGGTTSVAADVNDAGQVTGTASVLGDLGFHAFRFDNASGQMTDLGTLGGTFGLGIALNDLGQVAGQSATLNGEFHAFVTPPAQVAPDQAIQKLIDAVKAMVQAGTLSKGRGQALIAKLQAALAYLKQGQTQLAIDSVNAFANQVSVFVKTGKLTTDQGQPLIDGAATVVQQLGG
jgi:probable HAF family extracellular repeat protein/YD repeat-containing protein